MPRCLWELSNFSWNWNEKPPRHWVPMNFVKTGGQTEQKCSIDAAARGRVNKLSSPDTGEHPEGHVRKLIWLLLLLMKLLVSSPVTLRCTLTFLKQLGSCFVGPYLPRPLEPGLLGLGFKDTLSAFIHSLGVAVDSLFKLCGFLLRKGSSFWKSLLAFGAQTLPAFKGDFSSSLLAVP